MLGLFKRRRLESDRLFQIPDGERVYAIGDVHGRRDLARAMVDHIRDDAAGAPSLRHHLIWLGDYVDRGYESRQVIDLLLAGPPAGISEMTCLLGNHEAAMWRFAQDPLGNVRWLHFGGIETIMSYEIDIPGHHLDAHKVVSMGQQLFEHLPPEHKTFLQTRPPYCQVGDYLFVHAGIRPGIPLEHQSLDDLIWIRDDFLLSEEDHGFRVVHGHTIAEHPVVLPNRIGIDTGAFATNRLTCVVLEGDAVRFLEA